MFRESCWKSDGTGTSVLLIYSLYMTTKKKKLFPPFEQPAAKQVLAGVLLSSCWTFASVNVWHFLSFDWHGGQTRVGCAAPHSSEVKHCTGYCLSSTIHIIWSQLFIRNQKCLGNDLCVWKQRMFLFLGFSPNSVGIFIGKVPPRY